MIQEDITKKLNSEGRIFIGMANIYYPVYILHLCLKKPNNDPMYFIDWAILHFIEDQPDVNVQAVAWTLGVEKSLVDYRIKYLCQEHFLILKGTEYQILPQGRNYFFIESNEVPLISDSKDLMIDGVTLHLMDECLYEHYPFIYYQKNGPISRTPIVDEDDYDVKKVLDKLEDMTDTNKRKYNLPEKSLDYKQSGIPAEGIISVFVVFSIDKEGVVYKELYNKDHKINIPHLNKDDRDCYIKKCYLYLNDGKLCFNNAVSLQGARETANKILNLNEDDIRSIAKRLFEWESVDKKEYEFNYDSYEGGKLPLKFEVSYERLCTTNNTRSLVNAIKKGSILLNGKNCCIVIAIESSDAKVKKLLDFDSIIDGFKKRNDISGLTQYFEDNNRLICRQQMITLKRLDILEEMDDYNYIMKGC